MRFIEDPQNPGKRIPINEAKIFPRAPEEWGNLIQSKEIYPDKLSYKQILSLRKFKNGWHSQDNAPTQLSIIQQSL